MTTDNGIPLRICIDCRDTIPAERMQLTPHATRCVRCESEHEIELKKTSHQQAEKVKPKNKTKKPFLAWNEDVVESADGGFEIVKKRRSISN